MTYMRLNPTIASALTSQAPTMAGGARRFQFRSIRPSVTVAETTDPYLDDIDFARFTVAGTNDIACWGDSLTLGSGAGSTTQFQFPSVLNELVGASLWVSNHGVGGQNSTQIYGRIAADNGRHMGAIQVFWMGANDQGTNFDAAGAATVKANIAAAVDAITSTPKRYIVMSIVNGDYPVGYIGTARHTNLMQLNADLANDYAGNFIDIRQILMDAADPVIDADDITNGVLPRSLRSDAIHLNVTGYNLVANEVYEFMGTKGWL